MKKNPNKTKKGGKDWRVSPKLTGRASKDKSFFGDKNTTTRAKSKPKKDQSRLKPRKRAK